MICSPISPFFCKGGGRALNQLDDRLSPTTGLTGLPCMRAAVLGWKRPLIACVPDPKVSERPWLIAEAALRPPYYLGMKRPTEMALSA